MNNNLLIVGADAFGISAKEIAESMGCFQKIDFVDDSLEQVPDGQSIIGKIADIPSLASEYANIIVAMIDPTKRLQIIDNLSDVPVRIISLISPRAFVAPSASIEIGCIVQPMAVVGTGAVISSGCFVLSGAVVGRCSLCCKGVVVGYNATIPEHTLVPVQTFVENGIVFQNKASNFEL